MLSDGEASYLNGIPHSARPLPPDRRGLDGLSQLLEFVVPSGKRHVMMGATQISRHGDQNISAIGDWAKPKRNFSRAGRSRNTTNHPTSYWIPRHSRGSSWTR